MNRASRWAIVALLVAIAGVAWMQLAVTHYRHTTKRQFYGLAGYHYSMPDWGFEYHPGGRTIHRWTTEVPAATTLAALAAVFVAALITERRSGWRCLAGVIAAHLFTAVAFILVAFWYDINVTGLFI